MVGRDAFRNAFIRSGLMNVPKAALAALDHLDRIADGHDIKLIEFAFPYPYGRVRQLDERVGHKVDELMEKYHATVHLPMAPLHTVEGAMEITDAIDYGLDHGAGSFVIHPAEVEWGRFWRRSTGFDFAEAKTVGLNQLKGILQYYDKENITIAIENLAGPVPYGKDPNDFDYMFGKHGQLSAGLCLDVCHAVNVGLDPVALLQKYRQKEQLFEVHLADTEIINGPDKHCALGKGKVPLNTILDALRDFNGPVIIEVSDKDFEPSWKELVKILAANIGN